ncbi:MAG: hypothetical protein HQL25_06210 [Candidatus Omnitrophica bacterium]|nr:hypothetical protein [Candidatus Omnitrophota bacterium]
MSRILTLTVLLTLICSTSWARTYYYRSYNSQKVVNEFKSEILPPKNSQILVKWERKIGTKVEKEEYVLDQDYATLSWVVKIPQDNTDYKGERIGSKLVINGIFKGTPIQKVINIDNAPFLFNPKIGLMGFVKSDKEQLKYWGFRSDSLEVFKMQAKRKGIEIIEVNGIKTECYKIWWAPEAFAGIFNRIYWFRTLDGIYVKQSAEEGVIRELIKQE